MYDMSRGWDSKDNTGDNVLFYLWLDVWYYLGSPLYFNENNSSGVITVTNGSFSFAIVEYGNGGVRKVLQNDVLMCLICLKMDYEKEKRPKIKFVKFGSLQCR